MIEQFSTDDRNNIRRCLHQYVSLARRLRDGKDITEELRDDFERQSFNPVCLLTHDDSHAIRRSACRLCTPKGRRQPTANRHDVEILERLENAVEYYMGLGAGIVENTQLLNAFREVIELHWSVLRGRAIPA